MFFADLHVHSKYSRATSKDADLPHMAIWARKKGVSVLGTGDFTHPGWFTEIQESLVPAEPGLFRLREDLQRQVDRHVAGACHGPVRFLLQVEISTIYKKDDRTRKVHHLIYVPDLDKAQLLIQKLSRIGNLKSDGRPILGLDSRDLLEITLECGEGCYLVPAHIWTPWFAVLGSKSGFDSVQHCYGDLSHEIFALETGLSSDPPMNWRLSHLDGYRLTSNSDAHSPPKIGREACAFRTDRDYFAMRQALETGHGYAGTVEFFPEEGKYHLDGHRKCGLRLSPQETRDNLGLCPVCGKALTVGVMNRVEGLADRPEGFQPEKKVEFRSLVPLPEVIAEIKGVGEKSKRVQQAYEDLICKAGSELFILQEAPIEDLRRAASPTVAEAISRMRQGQVICQAGYDGQYGIIRLFEKDELKQGACVSLLFDMPEPTPQDNQVKARRATATPDTTPTNHPQTSSLSEVTGGLLDGLDAQQRAAAETIRGPLLIVAGPGTGKTRTLTHRIAHLVADHGVPAKACLAVTFSRRAAGEMTERLAQLLPDTGHRVDVLTFHALGLTLLRAHADRADLPATFRVADETERWKVLTDQLGQSHRQARRTLGEISQAKRLGRPIDSASELGQATQQYQQSMRRQGLVDFDDLIEMSTRLLESHADVVAAYRARWRWVSVDEFQDIDEGQRRLLRQLVAPEGNLCVIGDPDQSIYGFRGSDARSFFRFTDDYPAARTVHLTKNYRSSRTIVDAALQVITPSTLLDERVLESLSANRERIHIHPCPTERAEAEFVVHNVERLMGGTTHFSMDSGRVETYEGDELAFCDFAVLYRTEAQAEVLEEAFARSGIPVQRKSHRNLIEEPAIQAVAKWIQEVLASTGDSSWA